jgi:2-aminoadipate transaminase
MLDIQSRLAKRARERSPSPIRELMPYLSIPGMISLGGGYPNPRTFAFKEFLITFKSGKQSVVRDNDVAVASQYGPTAAHKQLGSILLEWHKHKDGLALNADQLIVLNGSQEGLFIAAYLFLESTDSVVLAEPVYPGATAAIASFCRSFNTVPLDAEGMVTNAVEDLLQRLSDRNERLPKFIYTVPSGHNPGGVTLSLERRKHLLAIARRFDLLILEDDPYQLVQVEEEPLLPTVQVLEGTPERVIRLDSFSKVFAPGLRIGYASGREEIMREFVLFKQSANLHTSMLVQELLKAYLNAHGFDAFREEIERNCSLYRENRDAMLAAAREFLPGDVSYNVPRHGMFIWFELPSLFDARRMIETDAENLKVLLVPGSAFSLSDGLKNCMRASYSLVDPGEIREGMVRFAEMLARERERCY